MKGMLLTTLLGFGFSVKSQTPAWQWAVSGSDTGNGKITGIAVMSTGDIIATGTFSHTLKLDTLSLTSAGQEDFFVARLTVTGHALWARSIGGPQHETSAGVAVDQAGNIYVAGSFQDSVTVGTIQLKSRGDDDIFLAKYTTNGNLVWIKSAGSIYADYAGFGDGGGVNGGITLDAKGHIYLTGSYDDYAGSPPSHDTGYFGNQKVVSRGNCDIFLAKYDTSGTVSWVKSAGGVDDDEGVDIKVDASGKVLVCGLFNYPWAEFNGVRVNVKQGPLQDMFIAQYDSLGNLLWVHSAGNTGTVAGTGISLDTAGNAYLVGGTSQNGVQFDGYYLSSAPGHGIIVAKYSNAGNLLWAKSAGGYLAGGTSIACDQGGNCYITGITRLISIFDNDTTNSTLFIARYNKDGAVQWVTGNGSSGGGNGNGFAVACDRNTGNVYLGGAYAGMGVTFGTASLPDTNDPDMFIAKLSKVSAGVPFINPVDNPVAVYPNPSGGTFTISTGNIGYTEAEITNGAGQNVYHQSLQPFQQTQLIRLPAEVSSGMYFIRLTGSGQTAIGKIMLQR